MHDSNPANPAPPDTGLNERNPPLPPFDNVRDTRFFYPSSVHGEALSRLLFLAEDGNMGIGMLTGEIGAGKTILRTVLHSRLDNRDHVRVSIENCLLDFDDLLLEIISQIRGERQYPQDYPDRYTRLAAFKKILSDEIVNNGKHLVILLDEAQQFEPRTLEAIKGLTNIASERQNFLTLILIGQPELRSLVRRVPQVDQRISLRYHLGALEPQDMRPYLEHRLHSAGWQGDCPFDPDAVQLLHQVSRGIPREINRICKLALEHALRNQQKRIRLAAIDAVVNDLRRHGGLFDAAVDTSS